MVVGSGFVVVVAPPFELPVTTIVLAEGVGFCMACPAVVVETIVMEPVTELAGPMGNGTDAFVTTGSSEATTSVGVGSVATGALTVDVRFTVERLRVVVVTRTPRFEVFVTALAPTDVGGATMVVVVFTRTGRALATEAAARHEESPSPKRAPKRAVTRRFMPRRLRDVALKSLPLHMRVL